MKNLVVGLAHVRVSVYALAPLLWPRRLEWEIDSLPHQAPTSNNLAAGDQGHRIQKKRKLVAKKSAANSAKTAAKKENLISSIRLRCFREIFPGLAVSSLSL
ncbi:MAG: hypothetical protein WC869_14915 [Phycisphaerae bacterium]|jgi:hypothetical protein